MVRFVPNGDRSDQGKAMCVLEARRVKKSFGEGEACVEAVRGVDFQVRRGEFVAVMGRSGSGKSTLLSMLGGIEPPTSGQIFLEGTDLATLDDDQRTLIRRRKVGFVFQMFNLLPILTAVENVTLPLELDGVPAAEANRRAVEMLDRVDMSARREHIPGTLSGGEQQRVAVARALAIRPTILLADEPTGNLDSANGQQITRLLRRLVDEQKQTLVIVTHDLLVADQADRVVHLSDGRVVDGDGSVAGPSIGGAAGERA
jgi:putative ABC transport system ATP-binding protein